VIVLRRLFRHNTAWVSKLFSVAAILKLLPVSALANGSTRDNSWDIAVINRALAGAKHSDKWVKFGDDPALSSSAGFANYVRDN
jgi:hypothetical protein